MPATARQMERYWIEPPDDEPMETCPECSGSGYIMWHQVIDCPRCSGTGSVPVDGSAAADVAADRAYDARVGA